MVRDRGAGHWSLRTGIVMAFVLLALGAMAPAYANDGQATGFADDVATPQEPGDDESAEPTPNDDPTPGGGSESLPPTATPGGEALAPGTVTVVVWTSDQGTLPERTTVCIGEMCQSLAGGRSGTDLWFDRVEKGWQQVVVRTGGPYGDATVDVEVSPGRNSRVELTLTISEPLPGESVEPTPLPVSAEGPLRTPPPAQESTAGPAWSVSALPSTGNTASNGAVGVESIVLGTIASLLLICRFVVRSGYRD